MSAPHTPWRTPRYHTIDARGPSYSHATAQANADLTLWHHANKTAQPATITVHHYQTADAPRFGTALTIHYTDPARDADDTAANPDNDPDQANYTAVNDLIALETIFEQAESAYRRIPTTHNPDAPARAYHAAAAAALQEGASATESDAAARAAREAYRTTGGTNQ
jgi:hypothetical protein